MCGYMLDNSSINRNIKSFLSITTSASSSSTSSSAATNTPLTRTLSLSSFYCSARKFHLLYQCFTKRSDTNLQRPSRNWSKSSNNWQIVLLTIIIILLQCCTSHVLAIRKGRLMTPSTFTALSGDLHVQIQFSAEDIENDIIKTSTAATTTTSTTTGAGVIAQTSTTSRTLNNQTSSGSDTQQQQQQVLQVENIITSTLVISKYIDETNVSSAASDSSQPLATANDSLVLQRQRKEIIENILLYPDPRHNVTQVSVPCQTFMQGGLYEMQVVTNLKTTNTLKANSSSSSSKAKDATPTMTTTTTTLIPVYDERLRQTLDVRWPSAEMIVSPVRLRTYPDTPVEVTLRFPEVNCDNAWKREDLPEFWLELIYCGKERSCSQVRPENVTKSSILFAEQVRGYPKQKTFRLSCDLFGLAGNYAVQLRPMIPLPNIPITRRFLSVDWSEKYVFNVYARSIFPCDPHTGIGVLYEYPSCILEQGDRVRVYAKLRADVASLKPPTTLHYIAEQRVVKNQYSLYFNCDLFTEKFVEYCFVYVSQAISGAVADVRMDCVPTLPVREFLVDEMSTEDKDAKGKKGGKGKGKKGKKTDPNKLNQVDKTFYELTITDLNQKLARLRSHLATLDDTNNNLKEKLRSLEEDRTDVAAHLEKTLAERNDSIKELEERLVEITKVRNNEKLQAEEHIKDLENKYKSMHDQLTSEIKLLNGKLNSLDEFRIQRDVLLAKFDDQEAELKEKDRAHQEAVYNMEQKAVVEKDALKKEVEAKLLQVSEDFTRSSEIRNAGYTRRLIRENIALQKEIDILVLSQIKMQQDFNEHVQKNKEMAEQYAALDQLKNQLIKSSQNKIRIIEKLTDNYERLKTKYTEVVKYRALYENITKKDVCDQFSFNETTKKLRVLGQHVEGLKLERNRLIALHEQQEAEIMRLQSVIQQIKLTVQIAIKAIEEDKLPTAQDSGEADESALRQVKRHNLLSELMELVSSHSDRLPDTPSIQTISRSRSSLYRPGKMGFMPRTASSLMEIFKREAQKLTSTEVVAPEFQVEYKDSQIIPKERISEAGSIVDVEMGSTLIVSSSHEDLEVVQMDEQEGEDLGEEGSSSDFATAPANTTTDHMASTADESRKSVSIKREGEEASDVSGELGKRSQEADSTSRGSRVSRMSRLKSLPPIDTDEYSINGPSVQTEKCGKTISDTWDCIYETSGSVFSKLNRTDVSQEIGPGCRCGCIVHLGTSKPKRIIAGATQSCPGRSFWLIQVDGEETISLQLNFLRLPCATQYIKIRDGPSLSSTLLIEMQGGTTGAGGAGGGNAYSGNLPVSLESSGAQLLLEFYAGEETSITNNTDIHTGLICTGGFLANVEQIVRNSSETTLMAATRLSVKGRSFLQKPKMKSKFTLVHLSAVIFASIIILISALLGAQYVIRYRKYHLAVARRRDEGSRLHTPHASMSSLQSPPSRAVSTTTLISEVIYMVKMRPKHQLRHSILRESIDAENLARETEMSETNVKEPMVKCVEEFGSNGSIVTLRNEIISPTTESLSRSPSTDDVMSGTANESNIDDLNPRSCGTLTRKDSGKDTESIISSGMSSICNSPPMNTKRSSRYSERYDASTLKMTNSYLEEKTDCESIRSVAPRRKSRCASVNLTNGCYSPAASIISSATIRSTNPKESKEKQNRKKLLARPGSEFSLGNQEDFELDYYDYNVTNAGSVPGSYLGMDPAYLVWIPPFDDIPDSPERDEDKTPEPLQEPDETQPLYQEIKMPKYGHYLSPHSNTNSSNNTTNTSPTSEELSPLSSNLQSKATTPSETDLKNCLIRKAISSNSNQSIGGFKQSTPYLTRKQRKQQKQQSKSTLSLGGQKESIPLDELNVTRSVRNLQQMQEPFREQTTTILETDSMNGSYIEKETSVVKSPSDLQNYLSIDDIQFADESESDHDIALATLKPQQQRKMSEKEALTEECQLLRDMKRVSTVVAQNRAQTVRRTQV
ncbi:uncharacterized protein LOC111681188 [Lucilia cuprina]|uniref:uncharacterized protein LOC111681188 n=1 Tax=Lucilia cuprina TaxID=7375 RepID=UPI001F05FBB4|nr:uncharacterized protein LOC111681188 [Lucilia cuprina]